MISLVVAYGDKQVIGKDNEMPWHLPNDLRHFKEITTGKTVVMGRNTYQSIGKPLPDRRNLVLTSQSDWKVSGVEVIHGKEPVLALDEVYIIGGAKVYEQFLPLADQLYITQIHHAFDGDTYFPPWDRSDFTLIGQEPGIVDEKNRYAHTFYLYQRKKRKETSR